MGLIMARMDVVQFEGNGLATLDIVVGEVDLVVEARLTDPVEEWTLAYLWPRDKTLLKEIISAKWGDNDQAIDEPLDNYPLLCTAVKEAVHEMDPHTTEATGSHDV